MAKKENKTPEEASNIFHNIMKASVTPKMADKKENEKIEKKLKQVKKGANK